MRKLFTKAEPPKKVRKNRTFIATTDGNVFPYASLKLAEIFKSPVNDINGNKSKDAIQKDSNQLSEENKFAKSIQAATRPFDFALFYWLYDNNVYMRRSIDQIATDVAGTGYSINLIEGMAEDTAQFDKASALLETPNWEYSIEDLWERFQKDLNITGNAPIEIVRDIDNEVKELWHVGASRIWPHKDKKSGLFIEKGIHDPNAKVYYVRFGKLDEQGNPVQVDKTTGEEREVEFKDRAHEMIHRVLYYPQSGYYGAPPILPSTGDVVMGVSARDYNLSFFINFGVPALLVNLAGEWEEDVPPDEEPLVDVINRKLKEIKGAENAHGGIVLQTPEGCTMTVEKLDVQLKEGSFRLIKADISQDVMVAYGMPPYRIGMAKTGALAGNVADEMLRTYISGVVEPGQIMIERMMNQIFRLGLQVENYELKLRNIELWDEKAQADMAAIRIRTGQSTPNQERRVKGLSEYIGGDEYFMESGLIPIGEDDTE